MGASGFKRNFKDLTSICVFGPPEHPRPLNPGSATRFDAAGGIRRGQKSIPSMLGTSHQICLARFHLLFDLLTITQKRIYLVQRIATMNLKKNPFLFCPVINAP